MNINQKNKIIDIHNHLIYGVDDGSKDLENSIKMLESFKEQGIEKIFATPHVNSSVSFSNRETQIKRFQELKKKALLFNIDLILGAEIYLPFRLPDLDFNKYTMGKTNIILVEFSTHFESPIIDHLFNLKKRGFEIIIAHIERYLYLKKTDYDELKKMGIYFQVNASSIVKNNKDRKRIIQHLFKNDYIDFIASDCHNLFNRRSLLLEAFSYVKKKFGINKAQKLFYENQKKILF